MYSGQKKIMPFVGLMLLILTALISCNEDPPPAPVLPVEIKFSITGDISANLESKHAYINPFMGQFLIGATCTSNQGEFDLVIFLSKIGDNSGIGDYPAGYPLNPDTLTYNHSWITIDAYSNQPKSETFWADSGMVNIEQWEIVDGFTVIKGTFSMRAYNDDSSKVIYVENAWFDVSSI